MIPFGDDSAALTLANRLAAVDFSADSRVRHALRARLLGAAPARRASSAAGLVFGGLAAMFAILATRPMGSPRESPLPVLAGRLPGRPEGAEPAFMGRGAGPVFETRAAESVFEMRPTEPVFQTWAAEPVFQTRAAEAVFETRRVEAVFESRSTSLGEIFGKPGS